MSVTAGAVMDGSAGLLSDPSKITFTYAYQLPFLRVAWTELQEMLVAAGLADAEETTAAPATITAGTKEWGAAPANLLSPIDIWEKAVGAPDTDFVEMTEEEADPSDAMQTSLDIWYFSEGLVKFRGATTDRVIQMKYKKELIDLANENTILTVPNVKSFLTFRNAALIAMSRGNKQRYAELQADAVGFREQSLGSKTKDEQAKPARPKRYGFSRRG